MDCYDEVLKIYHEDNGIDNYINYLTELINNKSKTLTELQFKNCLILTMVINNPNSINTYSSKSKEIKELDEDKKELLFKLLKSEFTVLDKEKK
jgi:lysyl-tRNA synthetase class I